MKIIFYSALQFPRVEYIVSILMNAMGLNEILFTQDQIIYEKSTAVKCNYSDSPIANQELWIQPSTLLFEKGVHKQNIEILEWNTSITNAYNHSKFKTLFYFFPTTKGDLPFDIFAASFYLLTRYEEYLPHNKDIYGRYAHENSLAFQFDFLKVPLVNLWLEELMEIIKEKNNGIQFSRPAFKFVPTYDIDIAWSYLHKGFARNAGGFLKEIISLKFSLIKERLFTLLIKQRDPFDSYEWLQKLHKSKYLHPIYFFLVAATNKAYDKNILPDKAAMQELIRQHAKNYQIGIHPSWQSGDRFEILVKEIKMLTKITDSIITQSRQHYIKLNLPETYRELLAAGISDDYSMGYGSINGFRSSYCMPYKWFDLGQEKITNLTIHPFCYMDANSFFEQRLNADQALEEMKYYYQIVKEVNGELITIWHNHFLGTDKMFGGWRNIYQSFIDDCLL